MSQKNASEVQNYLTLKMVTRTNFSNVYYIYTIADYVYLKRTKRKIMFPRYFAS